jgi:hypothetical protein
VFVKIHEHPPAITPALVDAYERLDLQYGGADHYASLVTPTSVCISRAEHAELAEDARAIATLYRLTKQLYLASLDGDAPPWIAAFVEHGLSPETTLASRLSARAGFEPAMARIDYVEVEGSARQIVEVQWKSGGPGFFLGHETAYRSVVPESDGLLPFGALVKAYIDALEARSEQAGGGVIINENRSEWFRSEGHVAAYARSRGVNYVPLERASLRNALRITDGELRWFDGLRWQRVSVLRGRGFTDILSGIDVLEIARRSVEGRIWVETPLDHVYRQKWSLSLPFLAEFQSLFPERVRRIVVPSALLNGDVLDLSPIARGLDPMTRERVEAVRSSDDLVELPGSVRARLVVKAAGGTGPLQSGGRGVFRLGGARSNAQATLAQVHGGVHDGEPWVIQPFVDAHFDVLMHLASDLGSAERTRAHMRFLLFAESREGEWGLQGAIGNFSQHWKVGGAAGRRAPDGALLGSAFTDVRIAADAP